MDAARPLTHPPNQRSSISWNFSLKNPAKNKNHHKHMAKLFLSNIIMKSYRKLVTIPGLKFCNHTKQFIQCLNKCHFQGIELSFLSTENLYLFPSFNKFHTELYIGVYIYTLLSHENLIADHYISWNTTEQVQDQ